VTELEVGSQLTIDHFQPKTAGGSDEIDNLVYACHACNLYKSQAWDPLDPPILHPLKADMNKLIAAESDATLIWKDTGSNPTHRCPAPQSRSACGPPKDTVTD